MTEEMDPKEVLGTMNATRVLISILETIKIAEVPVDTFIKLDAENRELNIDYDGDRSIFTFTLKEKAENAE